LAIPNAAVRGNKVERVGNCGLVIERELLSHCAFLIADSEADALVLLIHRLDFERTLAWEVAWDLRVYQGKLVIVYGPRVQCYLLVNYLDVGMLKPLGKGELDQRTLSDVLFGHDFIYFIHGFVQLRDHEV